MSKCPYGLDQPAFVMGRRMDILATNRMARALLTDFDARPPRIVPKSEYVDSPQGVDVDGLVEP